MPKPAQTTDYLNNKTRTDIQELQRGNTAKVDARNTVTHTFTTTANETFRHGLGRKPKGATVIMRDKQSNIYAVDSTNIDITMISSVADTTATILLI
jgi:hypothetical protein